MIFAHRGGLPEHTAAAVKENPAHGIEFDVRRSADGVLFCRHDHLLPSGANVHWLDYSAILSAEPETLTLDQMLALIRPDQQMQIEVKADGGAHWPIVAAAVVERVSRAGMADRAIITSQHHPVVAMVRSFCGIRTGLICSSMSQLPVPNAIDAGCQYLVVRHQMVAQVAADAHVVGLHVSAWTVNDQSTAQTAIREGADSLITDHPKKCLTWI